MLLTLKWKKILVNLIIKIKVCHRKGLRSLTILYLERLIAFLKNTFICFTWMEKLKKVFRAEPMVSLLNPRKLSSYLGRAKLYPMERKTGFCKYKGNRCKLCLNVSETETFISTVTQTSYKINTALTVNTNAWYIFWHLRPVLSSVLVVPQIVSDTVGTIINVMTENIREVRLVCNNIFLNILIMKGIMSSYMAFQLHWSIKFMEEILLSESTNGNIPSRHWHFVVLMLKTISKS